MSKSPEATRPDNSRKLLFFLPHRAIQFCLFQYDTTCTSKRSSTLCAAQSRDVVKRARAASTMKRESFIHTDGKSWSTIYGVIKPNQQFSHRQNTTPVFVFERYHPDTRRQHIDMFLLLAQLVTYDIFFVEVLRGHKKRK